MSFKISPLNKYMQTKENYLQKKVLNKSIVHKSQLKH